MIKRNGKIKLILFIIFFLIIAYNIMGTKFDFNVILQKCSNYSIVSILDNYKNVFKFGTEIEPETEPKTEIEIEPETEIVIATDSDINNEDESGISKKIVLDNNREKVSDIFLLMNEDEKKDYLYNDILDVLKNMESIDITSLEGQYKNAHILTNGIYLYFDDEGQLIKDLRDTLSFDDYVISINKSQFDTTIYGYEIEDGTINYTPIVTFPCSVNAETTIVGKFLTTDTYRWHEMANGTYAQYCVRFDKNHLFHSALYRETKPNTLIIDSYNGINRKWYSGGCNRMRTGDAYYIYKINKYHTLVAVYESDKDLPFGREGFRELAWYPFYASESEMFKYRYDPTDPVLEAESIQVKYEYEPIKLDTY